MNNIVGTIGAISVLAVLTACASPHSAGPAHFDGRSTSAMGAAGTTSNGRAVAESLGYHGPQRFNPDTTR